MNSFDLCDYVWHMRTQSPPSSPVGHTLPRLVEGQLVKLKSKMQSMIFLLLLLTLRVTPGREGSCYAEDMLFSGEWFVITLLQFDDLTMLQVMTWWTDRVCEWDLPVTATRPAGARPPLLSPSTMTHCQAENLRRLRSLELGLPSGNAWNLCFLFL